MYKVITDEHLEYIKTHSNLTDAQIGATLKVNSSTIRNARQRLGIYKDRKINISKEELLEAYENNNRNMHLTAKALNTNRSTLRKIANSYGIKTDRLLNLSEQDILDICAKYETCTAKELAKKYNCSVSKIHQIWMQNNLYGKTARTYHLDESYFDTIDTPSKAYFVGFIASDGCLYASDDPNKSSIIRISISSIDESILKIFQRELNTEKPLSYCTHNNCNYVSIEICSNLLVDSLKRIGLTTVKKTYGNTVPDIRDDLMPHFIRGYFDGDGSIPTAWSNIQTSAPKAQATISGYKRNMEKLINYLVSKNIHAIFVEDKRNYNGNDTFGSLSVSNITSMYCFLKLIYKDCREYCLERKKVLADNMIKYTESNENIRYKQAVIYYKYAVQAMC